MSLTKNEIKFIKSLQQKRNRDSEKLFIIEGEKMVDELFNQTKFSIKQVLYTEAYNHVIIPNKINSKQITEKNLDRITGFKKANKVLALVTQNKIKSPDYSENNLILLLDDVNDPGNLGTIIRTADWFGITQIIASKNTVELYNPKVLQSSMGAVYRMNYFVEDLNTIVKQLKLNEYKVLGATIEGENVYKMDLPAKTALIMGSESHGIKSELLGSLDIKTSIPKFGNTESLNVAMATGILLSEYKR